LPRLGDDKPVGPAVDKYLNTDIVELKDVLRDGRAANFDISSKKDLNCVIAKRKQVFFNFK